MLPENPIMIAVGIALMLLSRFATHRAGLHGRKPLRPVTDTERVILFSFGLLAFALGLFRMLHK